jgi:hypothetical protein
VRVLACWAKVCLSTVRFAEALGLAVVMLLAAFCLSGLGLPSCLSGLGLASCLSLPYVIVMSMGSSPFLLL